MNRLPVHRSLTQPSPAGRLSCTPVATSLGCPASVSWLTTRPLIQYPLAPPSGGLIRLRVELAGLRRARRGITCRGGRRSRQPIRRLDEWRWVLGRAASAAAPASHPA